MHNSSLTEISNSFCLTGTVASITALGDGLINDTYLVTTQQKTAPNYVLQRINSTIFTDVPLLQYTIEVVTRHIRAKLKAAEETDIDRKVLSLVSTERGDTYYELDGTFWRMMLFIPDTLTYNEVTPSYAEDAGRAFGRFQSQLIDLPETLSETIPNFHNMEFRLQQLREAVKQDVAQRACTVQPLLDELEKRADLMCQCERLHREGKLPKRICHCDTKVNNMLFDDKGQVLCVIDLDTVMPSFILSDVGDFLRTAANTAPEDEPDLNKISFNMSIFKAFIRGYLASTRSFLTSQEIDLLPHAACLFAYMQCVRFLTDYINGDTYYKIAYDKHNLVRSNAQFKLLQSAELQQEAMKAYIATQLENKS